MAMETTAKALCGCVVVIEGTVAAGKTVMLGKLQRWLKQLGVKSSCFEENLDKQELEAYVRNPKANAARFQEHARQRRLLTFRAAESAVREDNDLVAFVERGTAGDFVFAIAQYENGNMTLDEFTMYCSRMCAESPYRLPDRTLVLFLKIESKKGFQRYRARGGTDTAGDGYSEKYYNQVCELYNMHMARIPLCATVYEHPSTMDGIDNLDNCSDIVQRLLNLRKCANAMLYENF